MLLIGVLLLLTSAIGRLLKRTELPTPDSIEIQTDESATSSGQYTGTHSSNQRSPIFKTAILLGIAGILAIYFWFLPQAGFVLMSTIALLVLMTIAGERRLHLMLPISILLPLGLYFFFNKIANIPIPAGVLQPWLVGS